MWDPRQNTSLTTWDTNRHWVWDPRQHFNMEEEYSALDKTKYFPAVSQQNASVCWAARTFYGGDREETSYFMCSLHNANMLEENQHCSIQSVARLYFLMNETLINLRSGKNTGPSPLTGLWVQWQCGDNEDLCHHNWDGSMKYSFITQRCGSKKYPPFTVVLCAQCPREKESVSRLEVPESLLLSMSW